MNSIFKDDKNISLTIKEDKNISLTIKEDRDQNLTTREDKTFTYQQQKLRQAGCPNLSHWRISSANRRTTSSNSHNSSN